MLVLALPQMAVLRRDPKAGGLPLPDERRACALHGKRQ